MKRIDNKFSLNGEQIISNKSGSIVPDHEPKILFRGKDKLAIPMLQHYLALCLQNGCSKEQEESMRAMIHEFEAFRDTFTSTMKLPD
jgi:hypothetical protein